MGVDCDIYLHRPVDMDDVGEIIAVLLGNEHHYEKVPGSDALFHRASGVRFVSGDSGDRCNVTGWVEVTAQPHDFGLFYILEHRDGVLFIGRSYARTIAVAKRLVDIYGGKVDFNDCDSVDVDYMKPKPSYNTNPQHGEEWNFWQRLIHDLKPITAEEIEACIPYAAYGR